MIDLAPEHLDALAWFAEREGRVIGWPEPLPSGLFLVNRPKGIHKPVGWDHALSIRVSRDGPYVDGDVQQLADGSWRFRYHQEGAADDDPDDAYTNRALIRCRADGVPIGVLKQVKGRPSVQYEVLGLGSVAGYANGFFEIVGPIGLDRPIAVEAVETVEQFNPASEEDARRFVTALIHRRQGQRRFRNKLLDAYRGRCAISGCDVEALLDAAHIVPYRGDHTNVVQNGLLLRTDLHTLFDLRLISVDASTMCVGVSEQLRGSEYEQFLGRKISLPDDRAAWPSPEALSAHDGKHSLADSSSRQPGSVTTATFVTWNIDRIASATARAQLVTKRILAEQPEVICLTEARWDSLQSFGGHLLDIRGFGWAPETVSDDEREVLLWSHEPWADVVLGGGDDLERGGFIAATTTTSVGKIRVIGICVPYHMARVPSEKQWSEQIRFLKSLGGFLGKQARRLPTVILGDFNQLIPRTWGSADADLARVEALDGFVVCTHGVISGADYAYVDHVALDESLKAVSIHAIEQENNGARLTGEHFGVVVRLQHVEAPTAYSRLT